ncbi:hypothetical protein D0T90_01035 [Neisseria animalis]|uniref:Uncharacterized protein n=2 Tax=Neisseria animalis TaxID=492 RepID=A0A5P3MNZ6_NEIAN|nr:hypothetical protein D0T90_01035 [Neisseria animalis]ROW31978.1 hypothetical protein CGZ60_07380 [Neisseria animalis]VEE08547.1 Uncharacterised protein [Neisseria animalis]
MQNLLDKLKIPVSIGDMIDLSSTSVYCNYWVGSPRFWQAYMAFADEFYRLIEEDADNQLGARSFVEHSYVRTYPMIPFIMERLPTLFMRLNPQFKRVVYEYPEELLKKRWGVAYDDIVALKQAKEAQDWQAIKHHTEQLFSKLTPAQLKCLYAFNYLPEK